MILIRTRNQFLPLARRRGAAVVEMAVVSPLLVALVLGICEFGWSMMVRGVMINAARDGCRAATRQYNTVAELERACLGKINAGLARIGLQAGSGGCRVEMTHAADPPVPPDDVETVILSIPYQRVSLLGNFFRIPDMDIRAGIAMRKEF